MSKMIEKEAFYIIFQFIDGQMGHVPRYDVRPQMGIIYTGNAEHAYFERWMDKKQWPDGEAVGFFGKSFFCG